MERNTPVLPVPESGRLPDLLERNAQLYPDETALIELNPIHDDAKNLLWKDYALVETGHSSHYRSELTWKQFDDRANRVANMLIAHGVKRGDKVAILLMNCIEWLPIYFGVMKTGALAVPMNFRYTSEEIAYCTELSQATVLFFASEFLERVEAVKDTDLMQGIREYIWLGLDLPAYATSFEAEITKFDAGRPEIAGTITPEDDGAIYFSSGTTGFPKAILHSHNGLYTAAVTEYMHHGQTHDDIFILIPPLYHTGAKMHWFGSLVAGAKTILLKGTDPGWVLDTAAKEKASIVWLLVPWARDIIDYIESHTEEVKALDFSHWRMMHIGAQPVPPSLVKRWKELFPAHDYDTNYGLSESTGPGCVHLGLGNEHKVGAIGKAGHGWQTRVVDENGDEVPRGTVGELIVKGPGVMREYYRNPEATAETLKDGWLFTGDMAKEDEDGFLFLVDRKKDVIISGGENLYPVQIEDFLHGFAPVKDVAVIGVPDERLGEIALAVIELKPEAAGSVTEADVAAYLEGLPRYKRPRRIVFEPVPRNATGKIEKPKLRERFHADAIVAKQTAE
ncbi:MAG: acyl--CoA ligase [Clostridiales Family XIII bacterium]|jgi:acyl-CoA synthetase (AMP-forming)/AMP-acid ligase II|nr:acyl--CoA ligase [Clostridiales Family XIII bacterium]